DRYLPDVRRSDLRLCHRLGLPLRDLRRFAMRPGLFQHLSDGRLLSGCDLLVTLAKPRLAQLARMANSRAVTTRGEPSRSTRNDQPLPTRPSNEVSHQTSTVHLG